MRITSKEHAFSLLANKELKIGDRLIGKYGIVRIINIFSGDSWDSPAIEVQDVLTDYYDSEVCDYDAPYTESLEDMVGYEY